MSQEENAPPDAGKDLLTIGLLRVLHDQEEVRGGCHGEGPLTTPMGGKIPPVLSHDLLDFSIRRNPHKGVQARRLHPDGRP